MTYDLGVVLDGVILVFLGVTIFYAARLSLFFKAFRDGRDGVQILIRDLSLTVDKAQASIKTMKVHVKETEEGLRETIREARSLSEELGFMNESGDALANRLEQLADRNRELIDMMEDAGGIGSQAIKPFDPVKDVAQPKAAPKKPIREKIPELEPEVEAEKSFEISDFDISEYDIDADDERDFLALEDGAYRDEEPSSSHKSKVDTNAKSKVRSFAIFDRDHADDFDGDTDNDDLDDDFSSRAERDLYEALQRKKRMSEV